MAKEREQERLRIGDGGLRIQEEALQREDERSEAGGGEMPRLNPRTEVGLVERQRRQEGARAPACNRKCRDCVFAQWCTDGRQGLLICAASERAPGQMVVVQPEGTCRHFRRKRGPIVRVTPPEPPNDEIRYIPLTQGKHAIVDKADYERVARFKWCVCGRGDRAYAVRSDHGKHVSMHRFLLNPPEGMVVDHINGNKLDNRACNTRICTQQQNTFNSRPKGKSSKFKGVCWDKWKKKWLVPICIDGKNSWVGRFDDEIEAARAYDRKAAEVFKEYAYLNFPGENPRLDGDPPPGSAEAAEDERGFVVRECDGGGSRKVRRQGYGVDSEWQIG